MIKRPPSRIIRLSNLIQSKCMHFQPLPMSPHVCYLCPQSIQPCNSTGGRLRMSIYQRIIMLQAARRSMKITQSLPPRLPGGGLRGGVSCNQPQPPPLIPPPLSGGGRLRMSIYQSMTNSRLFQQKAINCLI